MENIVPKIDIVTPLNMHPELWMYTVKEILWNELKTKPGITGIDVGLKETDGQITDRLAIRVHVSNKTDNPPEDQEIPDSVLGIPTDVLEREYRPSVDDGLYNPLRGGVAIGADHGEPLSIGTMGAVITYSTANGISGAYDPSKPSLYLPPILLSNHHVLFEDHTNSSIGDSVYQPAVVSGGNLVGTVLDGGINSSVDVGISSSNREGTDNIIGVGTLKGRVSGDTTTELQVGQVVVKRGRTTGRTRGTVTSITANVIIDYPAGDVEFFNQIIISPEGTADFQQPGDSGSLLVRESDSYAVGLMFAESDGNGDGIANHIYRVFFNGYGSSVLEDYDVRRTGYARLVRETVSENGTFPIFQGVQAFQWPSIYITLDEKVYEDGIPAYFANYNGTQNGLHPRGSANRFFTDFFVNEPISVGHAPAVGEGYSAKFEGGYLEIGGGSGDYETDTSFSLEAWVKIPEDELGSASSFLTIYRTTDTLGNGVTFSIETSTGKVRLGFKSVAGNTRELLSYNSQGVGIIDGCWHHVVAVYNFNSSGLTTPPRTMVIYIDGFLSGTTTFPSGDSLDSVTPKFETNSNKRVGIIGANGLSQTVPFDSSNAVSLFDFFYGYMDEFAYYGAVIDAASVRAHSCTVRCSGRFCEEQSNIRLQQRTDNATIGGSPRTLQIGSKNSSQRLTGAHD